MSKKAENTVIKADVAISGGGLVGLTLGCGLAAAGFKVVVADAQAPEAVLDAKFDGRSSAIAFASARLFKAIGVWKHLEANAQPIEEIHVTDGQSPLFLHFDMDHMGTDGALGQMLENRHTRQGLFHRAKELKDNLIFIAPDRVVDYDADSAMAHLKLESGTIVEAPLLIAADGRGSPLRKAAGINTFGWGYDQWGVVTTMEHEHPHCGIAHEHFLPEGPFAILPLPGNRSSIVWSTSGELAPEIMKLSDRAFDAELQRRVGGFLGDVKHIGPRWCYPLTLQAAERYVDNRLALVGDAAHGVHPIAGQGMNLGLRDVAALIEVLVDARALGQDLGSAQVLSRYERWRLTDNVMLAAVMDGLTRLFSNDVAPIKLARDIGLAAVEKMPRLKTFFISHARGTFGDKIPKLLDGDHENLDILYKQAAE